MATVTYSHKQAGVPQMVAGSFTSDNAAQVITLGFRPTWFKFVNETDVIVWEKFANMVAANSIKTVTAGTTTVDTTSAIVVNTDGTVTLAAAAVGNAKAIKWIAAA